MFAVCVCDAMCIHRTSNAYIHTPHNQSTHSRALLAALGSNPLRLLCARLVREYAEWPLVLWTTLALLSLAGACLGLPSSEEEEEAEEGGRGLRLLGGVDGVLLLLALGAMLAGALPTRACTCYVRLIPLGKIRKTNTTPPSPTTHTSQHIKIQQQTASACARSRGRRSARPPSSSPSSWPAERRGSSGE